MQSKTATYLHKTQGEKRNIVGTEKGVEEDFLDSVVEICFQTFYFIANKVWRQRATMGGDGRGVIKLFF
jgi:hypothetical protein